MSLKRRYSLFVIIKLKLKVENCRNKKPRETGCRDAGRGMPGCLLGGDAWGGWDATENSEKTELKNFKS